MEKTIKEWLELMPLEVQKKALVYSNEENLQIIRESFSDALKSLFIFKNTKEGHEYWYEISEKY